MPQTFLKLYLSLSVSHTALCCYLCTLPNCRIYTHISGRSAEYRKHEQHNTASFEAPDLKLAGLRSIMLCLNLPFALFKMWRCRSKAFDLGPKVQKFKPSTLSDSQFAHNILEQVGVQLHLPSSRRHLWQSESEECMLLPLNSKSPFMLAKPGSTRRYSAIKLWKPRSRTSFLALDLHRFILWCKDGAPVGDNQDALHIFDCRPGCINPAHVRWGTPQENADDRLRLVNVKKRYLTACLGSDHCSQVEALYAHSYGLCMMR